MRVEPLTPAIEGSFLKFLRRDVIANYFALLDLKFYRGQTKFWIALEDAKIEGYLLDLHKNALESALRELSRYAKGKTCLCIENSPFSKIVMDVLDKLLSEEENIFLAWDIAKTYNRDGSLKADVEEFFLKHLDKVRECHLHDRSEEGPHDVIGKGKIDFVRYLNLLGDSDVGYTIEVRPRERALHCLQIIEGFKNQIK